MGTEPTAQPSVRLLTPEELPEAARVVGHSMLGSVTDAVTTGWAKFFAGQTTHGAISAVGELVGVARWFSAELSLNGPSIPAAGVTAVAVATNHRRQGHLSRLMHEQLRSIAEGGVPIALLVAAEWPIYGRFGYGPAIDACGIELDTALARFAAPRTGTVELTTAAELRPQLERVHDLRWTRTIGAITHDGRIWDVIAGVERRPGDSDDPGQERGAIWRDAQGVVLGAVAYRVTDGWTRNRPTGTAHVNLLVGATPEAERELWRHLCEIDWVSTVKAGNRSIDDPLQLWLDDGRAVARVDRFDCIWARILDVPAVFGARRAPVSGRSVVEVVDDLGFAAGRWALELGPDGADVVKTSDTAEVRLPVAALGAASLGGTPVTRLHDAGWVDEERPGGVARLDALLRSPTAPWSPTTY